MKATINNCHDEQILKELCSIFERGLIQKEIFLSVDDAQNEEEAYNVICTKYGISHKTADFIFHTTFNHWFSPNYDKVKSAYDSIARETLGRNSFHNGINMDYYIPLLKTFCQKTMSIYDKGYDQGPFIPYTMTNYSNAPIKIMYVGRDTYYWEPAETLKKAFRNNKLEDYLIANAKCVDVDKMLTWKNNTGSFWNFVNKLHLMIRTGQMVSDITTIDDKQKSILEEIGYGNLYSIEMLSTLRKRFEESELPITSEYETICKAAKPFETLKSMIEAYHPDYVFVLSWIEKNDFFEGTDFVWQKDLYQDADKKYRAVYLSNQYDTKVIWTLHPNAMWRRGLSKNDTQELIEFLANTYRMFESKSKQGAVHFFSAQFAIKNPPE